MKRKLILLLSAMALMIPQMMWAQEEENEGVFWNIHKKDNNPDITLDTKPEEITDNLMMAIEDLYADSGDTISDLQKKFLTAYEHVGMASEMVPMGITRHQMTTPAKTSRTYNLYGITVSNDYKGIVIKDGKKITNK